MSIRCLNREDIDTTRWDELISGSSDSLIYARSALLDRLSPSWKALVYGDYEAVMPLTWKKKYMISYLHQPPFLQQLGVFGVVSEKGMQAFSEVARAQFRFAEINTRSPLPGTACAERSNYVLDLSHEYSRLCARYSPLHQKNLKRAEGTGLQYISSSDHRACIELSYSLYQDKTPHVRKDAYESLASFAHASPGHVFTREVRRGQQVLASAFCLMDRKRIYFIINNIPPEGRKALANHWLVDHLIREFSGSGKLLDLEGSDLPGIAEFYKGFGALNEPYYFCKWNRFPWPLKLFKR